MVSCSSRKVRFAKDLSIINDSTVEVEDIDARDKTIGPVTAQHLGLLLAVIAFFCLALSFASDEIRPAHACIRQMQHVKLGLVSLEW